MQAPKTFSLRDETGLQTSYSPFGVRSATVWPRGGRKQRRRESSTEGDSQIGRNKSKLCSKGVAGFGRALII